MNRLVLFFAIALIFFSEGLSAQEILFPKVILKNVETEVQVLSDDSIDVIVLNGESLPVTQVGGHQMIKLTLSDADIHFENSDIVYSKPVVIPGWLSILPPLIAIALALNFKEVLSSLLIAIFFGAAIYGL